jgi:hypothetical protein
VPVNTEKAVLDLYSSDTTTRSNQCDESRTSDTEKLRPTDPEHRHLVLKIKFVMSSCGLCWGRGRIGEGGGVRTLVETLVPTFREKGDGPHHNESLKWSGSHQRE